MCDFEKGFQEPEMVKKRPVILLTKATQKLVTVVPLSTTPPDPQQDYHCFIEKKYLPNTSYFQRGAGCWVKGDMLYTVSFARLEQIRVTLAGGKAGFFTQKLGANLRSQVQKCVLHGLDMPFLIEHIKC